MPLDGSGNYTRARDWTTDEGNALNIEASLFDEHDDDLATALNTAFYRDGQAPATGTFDMNGNKIDLDADADTSIHASTDDQIDFEIGATDIVRFKTVSSAVNGFDLIGSATLSGVDVTAFGTDTNIDINLNPKGSGSLVVSGVTVDTGAVASILRGFISGLVPSIDTDTDHDINFTAGIAAESAGAHYIDLAAEITKQIDATWAVGDDAGGLFSGASLAIDSWYHLFVIRRSDTGVVDAGFDDNATATNIPTNYDSYRRVGSVLTGNPANIVGFTTLEVSGGGLDVLWDARVGDVVNDAFASTAQTATLSVPTGYVVQARIIATHLDSSPTGQQQSTLITSLDQDDEVATAILTTQLVSDDNNDATGGSAGKAELFVRTNTSGQVRYRNGSADADTTTSIYTTGWQDGRR